MTTQTATKPIIFFDGVCNLCNRYVQFIIKHDKKAVFMFAPLQSAPGKKAKEAIKAHYGIVPDSIVVFIEGRYYYRSDAVFKIIHILGGALSLLLIGKAFPRSLRDGIYDLIARNRYKWFGKKDVCMIPSPDLQKRFLPL